MRRTAAAFGAVTCLGCPSGQTPEPQSDIQHSSLSQQRAFGSHKIEKVELLGSAERIEWKLTANGLTIAPSRTLPSEHAILSKCFTPEYSLPEQLTKDSRDSDSRLEGRFPLLIRRNGKNGYKITDLQRHRLIPARHRINRKGDEPIIHERVASLGIITLHHSSVARLA